MTMEKQIIINIGRQFGAGGLGVAHELGRKLGIPVYDKELIKDAAAKGSLNEEVLRTTDESAANSLLYTLAMGSNTLGAAMHFGYKMPLNDKLFILQSEVIKEYAAEGSCVVIGRCADYVLRDEPNILRLFIYGDLDHREARIHERHPELKSSQIIDVIGKTDKRRSSYYNFYTGNKWGAHDNYDLAINSSTFGVEKTAEMIANLARNMMEE